MRRVSLSSETDKNKSIFTVQYFSIYFFQLDSIIQYTFYLSLPAELSAGNTSSPSLSWRWRHRTSSPRSSSARSWLLGYEVFIVVSCTCSITNTPFFLSSQIIRKVVFCFCFSKKTTFFGQHCFVVPVQIVRTFSLKGMTNKLFGQEAPEQREARLKLLEELIAEGEDVVKEKTLECE